MANLEAIIILTFKVFSSRKTMWKSQDFSITQILREINFQPLEVLNIYFYEFLHFLKAENYQINKIQCLKYCKTTILELLDSPKLILRKI